MIVKIAKLVLLNDWNTENYEIYEMNKNEQHELPATKKKKVIYKLKAANQNKENFAQKLGRKFCLIYDFQF